MLIAGRAMPPGLRMPPPSLTARLKARPVREAAESVISCTFGVVSGLLHSSSAGDGVGGVGGLGPCQEVAAAVKASGEPQGVVGRVR